MDRPKPRRIAWQDTAVGAAIIVLAGVVAWQTTIIPENAVYAKIGPKVVPWISAGLLAMMGTLLSIVGLCGGWAHEQGGDTNWRALVWIGTGLLLNVTLISHAGFIVAGSLLFVCTARAFGSVQLIRDAAIGLCLGISAYIGFDRLLGYRIGSGLIESLL